MASRIQTRSISKAPPAVTALRVMREDVRAFKREIILNTAIDIFYDRGYQCSSVDDIAAAMSVTKAVIYYNFDSKEEVLSSIVDRTLSYTHESIDRGIAAGSTLAQKLALACFFYAAHILTHQKMIAVYFREERNFPVALRRRTSLLEKSVDEKIAAVLGAGVISREFEPLDSRLMAITIMGMMSMNFYWYRARGRLSAQGLCRQFAEQALRLTGFTGNLDLDDAVWRLPT